jgi:hypothetical protein
MPTGSVFLYLISSCLDSMCFRRRFF